MTPEEIEIILKAQDYCRRRLAKDESICCPIAFPNDFVTTDNLTHHCRICFKWMGLDYRSEYHPCNELSMAETRKRFWRKPQPINADQIH